MNRASFIATQGAAVRTDLLRSLVGYSLRRTTISFMGDFARAVGELAIRPVQFSMLAVVAENPGINQTGLGRALGIQRANLVPLVSELLGRRLIERRQALRDRRAFALYLAQEGEELLEEATRRIRGHEERMLARLSLKDRAQLLSLLGRIERT